MQLKKKIPFFCSFNFLLASLISLMLRKWLMANRIVDPQSGNSICALFGRITRRKKQCTDSSQCEIFLIFKEVFLPRNTAQFDLHNNSSRIVLHSIEIKVECVSHIFVSPLTIFECEYLRMQTVLDKNHRIELQPHKQKIVMRRMKKKKNKTYRSVKWATK